jgi:hypothetical protein
MDRDWIVFGIPFLVVAVGTAIVLAGEEFHLGTVVTFGGLGVVLVGTLVLAGGIYLLPEPEGEEAH